MRRALLCALLIVINPITGCDPDQVVDSPTTTNQPAVFQYTVLTTQESWDVQLSQPLAVELQQIQSTNMPEVVWQTFPLPEFAFRSAGDMLALPPPTTVDPFGYGMDSAGCVGDGLVKANNLPTKGLGVAGGQYGYYNFSDEDDFDQEAQAYKFDPRKEAWVIAYPNDGNAIVYLEITFPTLGVMHVRRLKSPDMTGIPYCGPGENRMCRFAGYCPE